MSKSRTYVFSLDGEGDIEVRLDGPQSVTPDDYRVIITFLCGLVLYYGEDIDFREVRKVGRLLSQTDLIERPSLIS